MTVTITTAAITLWLGYTLRWYGHWLHAWAIPTGMWIGWTTTKLLNRWNR